jgi:hypothetical protein
MSLGMRRAVTATWDHEAMPALTIEATAQRLAELLTHGGGALADRDRHDLVFEDPIVLRPLVRGPAPPDTWAVDGGQALVADARCLQVVITRASRVRWQDGRCVLEDEGGLQPWLLGCGEDRRAPDGLHLPVRPDSAVDINLLRDAGEWEMVQRCVTDADPGALVLVDGDLQPDWRIPLWWLGQLLDQAAARRITVAGVTKHTSLARGGAPLLGQLEREADERFGNRATWWARLATTRADSGPPVQLLAARIDLDARFSFRVDLPAGVDPEEALGAISALADDAAFPGYPYPLTVADRLAACASWVRDEVRTQLDEGFDRAGVPHDVRERAFADRHRLMERA